MKTKLILIGLCILLFSLTNVSSETLLTKPTLTGDITLDSKNYLDYKHEVNSISKKDLTFVKTTETKNYIVVKFKDKNGKVMHLITKKNNVKK